MRERERACKVADRLGSPREMHQDREAGQHQQTLLAGSHRLLARESERRLARKMLRNSARRSLGIGLIRLGWRLLGPALVETPRIAG